MKRILTALVFPALLFTTPAVLAQQPTGPAAADTNPADLSVPLYPKKALKKLKKQSDEDISPYGLIATGKTVLVLSSLGFFQGGNYLDLILSASKDGTSWDKLTLALPKFAPRSCQADVAAVYDSVTKQIVLLACVAPFDTFSSEESESSASKKSKSEDSNTAHFYVAYGKGGKFSKLKDISKQFAGRRGAPDFRIQDQGLYFQGICLTKGEYRGRLVFLACYEDEMVCSLYSDDHGRTWKTGAAIAVPRASTSLGNGLTLCETEDGTLVSFTGGLETGGSWICSQDGGASWESKKATPGQPTASPGHWPNGYLVLNTKDGKGTDSRLLAVSLVDNHDGHRFHVAISYDWGRTWAHEKTIMTSAHNSRPNLHLQPIAPGTLGIITNQSGGFASNCKTEDITFTTFTLSWLTDGKDDGIDDEQEPAAGPEKP